MRSNRRRSPHADDGRWAILLGISALALVGVVVLDSLLVRDPAPRLVVLVVAVGVIAERVGDARTALGVGLLAWPLGNGFLERGTGVLRWDSSVDFPFAVGLLCAVALGMCAAQTRTAWRERRGRRRAGGAGRIRATGVSGGVGAAYAGRAPVASARSSDGGAAGVSRSVVTTAPTGTPRSGVSGAVPLATRVRSGPSAVRTAANRRGERGGGIRPWSRQRRPR